MRSWESPSTSIAGPPWTCCGARARSVRATEPPPTVSSPRSPGIAPGRRARPYQGCPMTSTVLPTTASPLPDSVTRRTGAAGIAAALAAAAPAWLDRVAYRSGSRWTELLPAEDAATVLDPALHADLADAQVWLLTWLPDQGTPLHDHGTSAGAF